MKTVKIRILTDILLYGAICFLAGTGLLMQFRLVPGFLGGRGLTVLGLSRHAWGTYHLWAAYLLVLLLLVHLVLNFAFIKNCIAARRIWIMVGLGLAGLFITFVLLLLPMKRSGEENRREGLELRNGQAHQEEAR